MQLHYAFPQFICETVNPDPDQEEMEHILTSEYSEVKRVNRTHPNILDETPKLKSWLQEQVDSFCIDALNMQDKLKITQSWAIKTQGMHGLDHHIHPNSIVSGAYYIKVPPNTDNLGFTIYKNTKTYGADRHLSQVIKYKRDPIFVDKPWLWDDKTYPAIEHHLYLFESHMPHGVSPCEHRGERCVLSFNTWFDGSFGFPEALTEAW